MGDEGSAVEPWGVIGDQGMLLGGGSRFSAEAKRTGRSWLEADR